MKNIKIATLFSILFFGLGSVALAAPWKSTEMGKHKAAYINDPSDPYIVGEPGNDHSGEDLIMPAGTSGVIHQWFEGTSEEEGSIGHHSVWRPDKSGKGCPDGWYTIYSYEDYGFDNHGYDYCVKTNDYHPSHYLKNN